LRTKFHAPELIMISYEVDETITQIADAIKHQP